LHSAGSQLAEAVLAAGWQFAGWHPGLALDAVTLAEIAAWTTSGLLEVEAVVAEGTQAFSAFTQDTFSDFPAHALTFES
jgi:hypothetical protein